MADDNRWNEDRSRLNDDRNLSGDTGQPYGQSYGQAGGYNQGYGEQNRGGGWGAPGGMSGGGQSFGQNLGTGEPLPYRPGQGYAGQTTGFSGGPQGLGGGGGGQSGGAYTGQTGAGYGHTQGGGLGPQQHQHQHGDHGQSWWEKARDRATSLFSGDDQASAQGSHRGKGPKSYSRSDDRIRDDVNDRLTDDPFLDASDVEVAVQQGEVTLTGMVTSRNDKRRAEDLADNVSGVKHVQNNLRVQGVGTAQGT